MGCFPLGNLMVMSVWTTSFGEPGIVVARIYVICKEDGGRRLAESRHPAGEELSSRTLEYRLVLWW